MKLGTVLLMSVTLAIAPRTAGAGPRKLKGEFLCGVYADGTIVKPLGSGKAGKITDTVACALHLDDAGEPGHAVHVTTRAKGKDVTSETGVVNEGDDDSQKDFEIFLKPNEAFRPCEDFEITARINDPGGTFAKTIKVVQGCPRPRPIKAELSCYSHYGSGEDVFFPKTKKLGGRLEDPIYCTIYAKKIPDGATLNAALWVKGGQRHTAPMEDTPPEGQRAEISLEPEVDFESCAVKFAIFGSLTDADGAERWNGKLTIPAQFCPD